MTSKIKVLFNSGDKKYTVYVPVVKEENMELVFKSKRKRKRTGNYSTSYLYNQYFYNFIEDIPKSIFVKNDNNEEYIDFSSSEPTISSILSLYFDIMDNTALSTILIERDDCYHLYSMVDGNQSATTIANSYMNYNDYYIVSTCINGYDYYDLISKNKLFCFPEKVCNHFIDNYNSSFINSIFDYNFDRIENVEHHEYEVGQIARENAIDPVDHAFEQYEILEEKIQENIYSIEEYLKIVNDDSVNNKKDYLVKINNTVNKMSSQLDNLEQWRQIMLSY